MAGDGVSPRSPIPAGLAASHGLIDYHPSDRPPILFLLGRIDAVRFDVHGEAVHFSRHAKICELAKVVRVVLLKHGDRPARASHVDSPSPGLN